MEFWDTIKTADDIGLSNDERKILVHCCCAVCFGYPSQLLKMLKYTPAAYFSNSNIYPKDEYDRRLKELENYCSKYNIALYKDNYEPNVFLSAIKGLENEPEKGKRCLKCFEIRLNKTAQKAKELNIKKFTTTLTVSPHKVSSDIFLIGNKIAKENNLQYLEFDFKKNNGFKITNEIAKYNNMYKQTYCGCEFSVK